MERNVTMNGSVRTINSTFIWDISDFPNKCKEVGEFMFSPYFAVGDIPLDEFKWCLQIYPFGDTNEAKDYLSLFLHSVPSKKITTVKASFGFYIHNNPQIVKTKFTGHNFKKGGWGFSKFLIRSNDRLIKHLSLSVDSTLRIACYITTAHDHDSNFYMGPNKEYLNTFFLSENLSDVTIDIDNKTLKAHQIILSSESKVFLAMFKHDTTEKNEQIIKITDVSYDIMKEVLRFIYCEKVENLDVICGDLLVAANKYSLSALKNICKDALMRNLNVSNACETLSIFDLHDCTSKKDETISFIIKHMKEVVDTEGFREVKDVSLFADILRQIALTKTD